MNQTIQYLKSDAAERSIEIGHLVVVLPSFYGLTLLRKADAGIPRLSKWTQRYGSVIISLFGLAYFYAAMKP